MPSLAIRRLQKEYLMVEKEPVEFAKAVTPLEGNLLECHFCVSCLLFYLFNQELFKFNFQ